MIANLLLFLELFIKLLFWNFTSLGPGYRPVSNAFDELCQHKGCYCLSCLEDSAIDLSFDVRRDTIGRNVVVKAIMGSFRFALVLFMKILHLFPFS